ncbi:YwmB family TATA-box binding protein [Anaerosinus massiliensis]|uniref:YwmB family TATA-box binding protein n=1 Tax=Massilibacillus massiliensis TaxID=1806837 RepID=UPI000DA5FCF3|nr:YwmB family TATA-box binding protein [Massilibacillus massiliensis]
MKKCIAIILLSLCVNFIFVGKAQNVPVMLNEPLSAAMQATGAEADMFYLNVWAKLPNEYEHVAIFMRIEKEIMKALGFSEDVYTIEVSESPEKIDVKANVDLEDKRMQITICKIISPESTSSVTYLTINYKEKSPQESTILEAKSKFKNIVQNFHATPTITTCLQGHLDGKLRNDEWSLYLQDAFDAIGATPIKKTDAKTYFSYTGFAPTIEERVIAGKDIVNLHMIMRYNEYDRRTHVIVGSPLISIEY